MTNIIHQGCIPSCAVTVWLLRIVMVNVIKQIRFAFPLVLGDVIAWNLNESFFVRACYCKSVLVCSCSVSLFVLERLLSENCTSVLDYLALHWGYCLVDNNCGSRKLLLRQDTFLVIKYQASTFWKVHCRTEANWSEFKWIKLKKNRQKPDRTELRLNLSRLIWTETLQWLEIIQTQPFKLLTCYVVFFIQAVIYL